MRAFQQTEIIHFPNQDCFLNTKATKSTCRNSTSIYPSSQEHQNIFARQMIRGILRDQQIPKTNSEPESHPAVRQLRTKQDPRNSVHLVWMEGPQNLALCSSTPSAAWLSARSTGSSALDQPGGCLWHSPSPCGAVHPHEKTITLKLVSSERERDLTSIIVQHR